MAADTSEKTTIKTSWFQFAIAQALALLVYSIGLAYWLGGFTQRVDQVERAQVVTDQRIADIDKNGTLPGKLDSQINTNQERRIQVLEEFVAAIRPKIEVIAVQVDAINKKVDSK